MSDASAENVPFWDRVRAALGAKKPTTPANIPIARGFGSRARLGAVIEEELARGWTLARGRRVSLSLLVFEIDRAADYFNCYGREGMDDCSLRVMEAIANVLPRPSDQVLRLGRSTFVLVLPDLPSLMARTLAGRVGEAMKVLDIPHRESHRGVVTVSAGLAVCNPEGDYDRGFFETATEALRRSQRKGLARLEAVDLRPQQAEKRKLAA